MRLGGQEQLSPLSQPVRLFILALYVAGLFVASKLALGTWLPPTSDKGLWFYSGLAAILLGSLLVTPFYTKPADAISYAVAALVALLSVRAWGSEASGTFVATLWLFTLCYVVAVLSFGVLAIALKDAPQPLLQHLSASLTLLADTLGAPRTLFSVLFLFALVSFHRQTPREYLWIGLAWALLVALRPLEIGAHTIRRLAEIWQSTFVLNVVGEIVGHETPGIVLVRQETTVDPAFGDLLSVPGDDGSPSLAMALDHVGFADGRWLRALQLNTPKQFREAISVPFSRQQKNTHPIALTFPSSHVQPAINDEAWTERKRFAGLVAPDTSISRLWVELVRTDLDFAEGQLFEAQIGNRKGLYQIINGLTKEEIVHQKNTRGFIRVDARKIGCWDAEKARFDVIRWMPQPNTPVFILQASDRVFATTAIGYVPGTNYPVTVNIQPLVTHNTAILGILGAGKSFLALELIERMLVQKVKVICLDLTNQYSSQLQPYLHKEKEAETLATLQAVGPPGKTNVQQNVEEGGSIERFRKTLKESIGEFLRPPETQLLKIINPAEFEVWRQDSKPFSGKASMAMLTIAEITRLVAEVTLEALQEQGMNDEARCCLVFEEAHSLIPEWSAVASEGDRTATNGTAKAILQGRKFGLGCMVITQRTANVTKSILNQCNTVFALRVFDATGMEFLSNYIGEDYANVLSSLEDRHAVAFGRAVSCRDPILIRLNDRTAFLEGFRASPRAAIGEVAGA